MDSENRNTFLSCAELLNQQIQRSNHLCLKLQRIVSQLPKPQTPALEQILEKEQGISTCIKNFVEQGPTHFLNTRLQYTYDGSLDSAEEQNDAAQGGYSYIINQLVELNGSITNQLEEAQKSMPASSDDAFDLFVEKVNALCKDISMTVVTMQDV